MSKCLIHVVSQISIHSFLRLRNVPVYVYPHILLIHSPGSGHLGCFPPLGCFVHILCVCAVCVCVSVSLKGIDSIYSTGLL